jgi:hypothetical protein
MPSAVEPLGFHGNDFLTNEAMDVVTEDEALRVSIMGPSSST